MLQVHGLSKVFPSGVGIKAVSFEVAPSETVAFLGPSGSGKSTLLRLLAGLETPDAGEITWNGQRLDRLEPHRRGMAFAAQRAALYPQLTVEAQLQKVGPTREAVELLRLKDVLTRYPHELSGGERQRVALARMVLQKAAIWLLDEPFSALDPVFRAEFRADLHLLREFSRATMIFVTHDPTDVSALANRVGVLGAGVLQQFGTPEELQTRPRNRFTAFCFGRRNLVDGVVRDGETSGKQFFSECLGVAMPYHGTLAPESSLTLGIRPEDVILVAPGSPFPSGDGVCMRGWTVVFSEPFGSGWLSTIARGSTRLRVVWPSGSPPGVGTSTDGFIPTASCEWFPD
jgi:multiple sugar transport system ATP-binding protein